MFNLIFKVFRIQFLSTLPAILVILTILKCRCCLTLLCGVCCCFLPRETWSGFAGSFYFDNRFILLSVFFACILTPKTTMRYVLSTSSLLACCYLSDRLNMQVGVGTISPRHYHTPISIIWPVQVPVGMESNLLS